MAVCSRRWCCWTECRPWSDPVDSPKLENLGHRRVNMNQNFQSPDLCEDTWTSKTIKNWVQNTEPVIVVFSLWFFPGFPLFLHVLATFPQHVPIISDSQKGQRPLRDARGQRRRRDTGDAGGHGGARRAVPCLGGDRILDWYTNHDGMNKPWFYRDSWWFLWWFTSTLDESWFHGDEFMVIFMVIYPPVNFSIAMKNQHFEWVNQRTQWPMFLMLVVCLPEGTPIMMGYQSWFFL